MSCWKDKNNNDKIASNSFMQFYFCWWSCHQPAFSFACCQISLAKLFPLLRCGKQIFLSRTQNGKNHMIQSGKLFLETHRKIVSFLSLTTTWNVVKSVFFAVLLLINRLVLQHPRYKTLSLSRLTIRLAVIEPWKQAQNRSPFVRQFPVNCLFRHSNWRLSRRVLICENRVGKFSLSVKWTESEIK